MKNFLKIISIFSIFFLTGCVVQSLNSFYIEESKIELPELNGQWNLVKEAGDDVSKDKRRPWAIKNDMMQTFDDNGVHSKLKIVFFKIENTIFLDTYPDEPSEESTNLWWNIHLVPIHSICKVLIQKDQLTLIPLDYSWLIDKLQNNEIKLSYITSTEDKSHPIFLATPFEWVEFLKKHKDNAKAFPLENTEFIFTKLEHKNL